MVNHKFKPPSGLAESTFLLKTWQNLCHITFGFGQEKRPLDLWTVLKKLWATIIFLEVKRKVKTEI